MADVSNPTTATYKYYCYYFKVILLFLGRYYYINFNNFLIGNKFIHYHGQNSYFSNKLFISNVSSICFGLLQENIYNER